jgi:hypothetical protein
VDNSCYIGGIFGQTSSGGTAVLINSAGKLGTATSSRRFKEKIEPMESASEALFALKPVTFRYKKGIDPQGIAQFGLVAEDVEAVNPDLVVRDADGKAYTVRYEAVNAMLLNEFLKEHRKVEELEGTVAGLAATVKEQASQIQKVSAQLEASKPTLRVVNNRSSRPPPQRSSSISQSAVTFYRFVRLISNLVAGQIRLLLILARILAHRGVGSAALLQKSLVVEFACSFGIDHAAPPKSPITAGLAWTAIPRGSHVKRLPGY